MSNVKIEDREVTKVFGKNPQLALKLLNEGKSKKDNLKETGINKASFQVRAGEIFVITGLSGGGNSTLSGC